MNINFALLFAGLNWPPEKPWILLITIPALILGIIPFLRLNKKRRISSKHLIPFIIHMSLILILSTVVAGISYTKTTTFTDGKIVMFVVDMSDSNAPSKVQMNEHMHQIIAEAERQEATYPENSKTKFGLVVFGGGEDGIIKRNPSAEEKKILEKGKDSEKEEVEFALRFIEPGKLTSSISDYLYEYVAKDETDTRDNSNLDAAINAAMDAIVGKDRLDKKYEHNDKKVILLSDGRENDGNVFYAVQDLAEQDISLECAYYNYLESSRVASEIQVVALETKGEAIAGKNVTATVTLNSTSRIYDVTIQIKDVVTDKVLATQSGVTVKKGISGYNLEFEAVQYDYTKELSGIPESYLNAFNAIGSKGIQAIKVDVSVKNRVNYECPECEGIFAKSELGPKDKCPKCDVITYSRPDDAISQNNTYCAWYKFKPQGKILVVNGDGKQLSQINLAALSASSGYEFTETTTKAFPDTLEKLLNYDEIILMNVKFSDLPKGATANIKRYVEEVGRGLLFTSGDNIYSADNPADLIKAVADSTKDDDEQIGSFVVDENISELLPVELKISKEKETIAMVLVVDLSSSMKEKIDGSALICKYCQYEDTEDESPAICPGCFAEAKFVVPTRYQVALSSVKKVIMGDLSLSENEDAEEGTEEDDESADEETEEEEKNTLQDYDYIGIVAFNQGYHVALDIQMLGDKENREKLCEDVTKEFDHFYYAHYLDPDKKEETDIRVNSADSLTNITGSDKKHDPVYIDGIKYDWYKVKYKRVEKNSNGKYTGEIKTYEAEYLLKAGGEGEYAPGKSDKATDDLIKSHGTAYKPPMQEASAMLTRASSKTSIEIKQIVFMSDGAPNDQGSGYEGIVERLAKGGTRTSAIAIGITEADVKALDELNKISTAGKGEIFLVDKAKDLEDTLFKITDEITKEVRNDDIQAEIMADSIDSVVYEGLEYVTGYDTIHGYYATTIKGDANRVFYVETLRPLYAEWEYGPAKGKVCVLMTDLGNKEWTGSLFDDTDGVKNSRLVQNILLSPIRNRVDSTGLEYSMVRNDEEIVVNISTPYDITKRDKLVNDPISGSWFYKEKIKAVVYVQEEIDGNNLWKNVGEYYANHISGNDFNLRLPTEFSDKTYVVELKLVKTGWVEDIQDAPEIDYESYKDDPVCDAVAFAVVGQPLEEYDILSDSNNNEAGVTLLSSIVSNKSLSDVNEEEDLSRQFFTNYNFDKIAKFFVRTDADIKEIAENHNIDVPLVILALILFIIDLIFRNFVIKKRKKKIKEMTDEEQIESMRGR